MLRLPKIIFRNAPRAFPKAILARRGLASLAQAPAIATFPNTTTALRHSFSEFDPASNQYRALYVNDCGVAARQYDRWAERLPQVRPFYAVKCNPDPVLLQELATRGAGFDCATGAEMKMALELGVPADDIILANPVKSLADIAFAKSKGVRKMTFDNEDEMYKINAIFPEAQLVLRLLPDDSGSIMRFGAKFGAPIESVPKLLALSKELDLSVIGVSFHIGSGCFEPSKYRDAISLARSVFTIAQDVGLPRMHLLDIGGGFPGDPNPFKTGRDGVPCFEEFALVIASAISKYFPVDEFSDLVCMSEPGRYFATAAGTLFTMVQGKRSEPDAGKALYYINDGVYGSFNSIMFDHAKPVPVPLEVFFPRTLDMPTSMPRERKNKWQSGPTKNASANCMSTMTSPTQLAATIFGPTCDSIDMIVEDQMLREMHVGDWLVFDHMGAYTTAAASEFNGCLRPVVTHVRTLAP